MTNKEKDKLAEISRSLCGAAGRLLIAATKDEVVKEANEMILQASFDLDNMIDSLRL